MSNDKTGGPAFPSPGIGRRDDDTKYQRDGMTLWDWYAGQALSGIVCNDTVMAALSTAASAQDLPGNIAIVVSNLADAMIAERKKRGIA